MKPGRSETRAVPSQAASGIVRPHSAGWREEAAAFSIWMAGRLLVATWRFELVDQSGMDLARTNEPVIYALWHNRLAATLAIFYWLEKEGYSKRIAGLISASRDGALLARTVGKFGLRAVRGSSSRRGPQALLELRTALQEGWQVAITPDGPRGPKYEVKPGIISLAQLSGVPIIPVGVHFGSKARLRSWDSFQVPFPFSRCQVVLGQPFLVPRDPAPEQNEAIRSDLEAALRRYNRD